MKKTVSIVIISYKKNLSEFEKISLNQAMKIFENYDKYLVIPETLEYSYRTNILTEVRMEDKWFKDIHSYNMLMTERSFYRQFAEYRYILIYQLDAFVFSDNLKSFCDMDYDYIGAPWIDGIFYYKDLNHMVWYVGNGGLSLRKVDAFLNVLETHQNLLVNNRMPEDLFFSILDSETFHIAPQNVALQFSFEINVKKCFASNKNKLPFGCHAWHRFDLPFWKPLIENYGYIIPEELIKKGQEDKSFLVSERRKEITAFWLQEYKKENLQMQIQQLFHDGNGKYAIWGAGYWGQMLCRMLEDAGIKVQVFIDSKKLSTPMLGHEIVLPDTFASTVEKYHIIVAVRKGYENIAVYLNQMGYQYRKDYVFFKDIELIYGNI